MDIVHLRANGNAVQTGQLLPKQTAFKPRMDGDDLGFCLIHPAIDPNHRFPQGRICPVFPSRITALFHKAAAVEHAQFLQLLQERLLFDIHTASHRKV